jgi:hypothetical protein
VFLILLPLMFVCGLALHGRIFPFQFSEPLVGLAALADLGIGVVYVVLYFTFGYFVAWQNPALRRYYGGTDPGSFLASVGQNWVNNSWIFPLQFARGILWVLFLLPLIRRFGRGRLETGLAMALFCAVWCLQLLFPNPYMPAGIRPSPR